MAKINQTQVKYLLSRLDQALREAKNNIYQKYSQKQLTYEEMGKLILSGKVHLRKDLTPKDFKYINLSSLYDMSEHIGKDETELKKKETAEAEKEFQAIRDELMFPTGEGLEYLEKITAVLDKYS